MYNKGSDNQKANPITVQDIWKAHQSIRPVVKKTPLIYSKSLSTQYGANIYLKYEHLHESGAFKMRGAVNAINQLSEKEKQKGVTTFSTGNHGLAVALAAKKLGIPSCICVSKNVPNAKLARIKELGATLEVYGEGQDDAEKRCYALQKEQGFTVIPPFDDPNIIAGQGTIALEILEELPTVDCVIAGLSGGGLLSGIGLVMKHTNPDICIYGISIEKGAAMHESLKAKKPITVSESPTLADSLLGGIGANNTYTFPMVKRYADKSFLIPETSIAKGMAYLYQEHGIIVEGAAAIGVGALLDKHLPLNEQSNVVLIVSGCNVDLEDHSQAIMNYI
ncbi:hydroxyectoine utilization dehydratase EutB [Oceanobacillus halophilus]|uniref:threonine ammonia-lyase n=1 Tax=Oceanobacillus halophilus TaxID=930130 RepID=A0A495A8A7_9BACI|nr:hydroxyectoine utilization dehydratase EutB [Oceanobacillus halophilus]RKQ35873.1 hydroxyectoine utilization dehydratase EutB [Oceanobacillus halophilus]